MSFPNLTAATQGRGFGAPVRPAAGRTTRLSRGAFTLLVLAAASFGSVGCQSVPLATADGSTARLVAAVDARQEASARPYRPEASAPQRVMLAGAH
ncbi:hypothetical protein [Alienimonas sp. DA493]|uniref:hypothetical protein n=1 Tax=Alienimonas sp. DA493 TaxID=3373605 RepID=UPI00375450D6